VRRSLLTCLTAWLALPLIGCGGGSSAALPTPTYTVGGQVVGLSAGMSVVLSDNGTDSLTVSANGAFSFAQPITQGGSYAVTVTTQPTREVCAIANPSKQNVLATVTTVEVTCAPLTYAVAGNLTGLKSGNQLVLLNNGGDPLTLSNEGIFTFASEISYGGDYAVTVGAQPTGQFCEVTHGAGSSVTADTSDISVVCSLFFDNFNRPDQVGLGVAPNTVSWLVSGQGAATIAIANHRFVDGSPTLGNRVAYALMSLGGTPTRLGGSFIFLPFPGSGSDRSAVALISTLDTGITFAHAVHLVVDRYDAALTYYLSGVSHQPASCAAGPAAFFANPLLTDGTPYDVEMTISGSHVVVALPQGQILDCTDAQFAVLGGAQAMWEVYSPSVNSDAAPAWNSVIAYP
jgi:hypothetical protein